MSQPKTPINASRRSFLKAGGLFGAAVFLAPHLSAHSLSRSSLLGFKAVPAASIDTVNIPEGYQAQKMISWGDPLFPGAPAFSLGQGGDAQAQQMGDNNDGMSFFSLEGEPNRGIMAVNSEYVNLSSIHSSGQRAKSHDEALREMRAVGVNVFEIEERDGTFTVDISGRRNRKLHAASAVFEATGAAAGSSYLQTADDASGRQIIGTFANCGNGRTPWGTYLTCEENYNNFFGTDESFTPSAEQERYQLSKDETKYSWYKFDKRFDLAKESNESNRFGWIVEVDPYDPESKAKKHTALGRFSHENAALTLDDSGHAVVYMGDDKKGEYIYKFVSAEVFREGDRAHNMSLLTDGTLYVARFNDDNSGEWLELTHGVNGLEGDAFPDQAYILVNARKAGDHVGATPMDRPEWVACNPMDSSVFCTLTNNKHRGVDGKDQPLDAANPRKENRYGQIIRWRPRNGDHLASTFTWDHFVLAGNPLKHQDLNAGSPNITADNLFNSPDGLSIDSAGRLWIQTDGEEGDDDQYFGMGNNQMLVGDPNSGEIRRFLVGPFGAEITGLAFNADETALFVGIQHPKRDWPNKAKDGVPRSTILQISRIDGGKVGG
jgi:hypothetical protein